MRLQAILDWVKPFWDAEKVSGIFVIGGKARDEIAEAVRNLLAGFNILLDGHRKQFGITTDKKPSKVWWSVVVPAEFH
jgi:hypothetical protein